MPPGCDLLNQLGAKSSILIQAGRDYMMWLIVTFVESVRLVLLIANPLGDTQDKETGLAG